jgi:hypothetical protein
MMHINMDGIQVEEEFEFGLPTIVVGNIIIGEKYIEPAGTSFIKNLTTGESCEMNFIARSGWIVKEKDKYNATAIVRNK